VGLSQDAATVRDGSAEVDVACNVECDCPDYAIQGGDNLFCRDQGLYRCVAAMTECGWSCTAELVQECEPRSPSCVDSGDGNARCCESGSPPCPMELPSSNLFCHEDDLWVCMEVSDPECGFTWFGALMEACSGECVAPPDGDPHCCPPTTWDCAAYLEPLGGGSYCQGDQLMDCALACLPGCGCSGQPVLTQLCPDGCVDAQDGQADCVQPSPS